MSDDLVLRFLKFDHHAKFVRLRRLPFANDFGVGFKQTQEFVRKLRDSLHYPGFALLHDPAHLIRHRFQPFSQPLYGSSPASAAAWGGNNRSGITVNLFSQQARLEGALATTVITHRTACRGMMRSTKGRNRLNTPTTLTTRPFAKARSPVSTTCSTLRLGNLPRSPSLCEKKSISVFTAPGQR